MTVDRVYANSSFLMYRIISDKDKWFSEKYPPNYVPMPAYRKPIHDSEELYQTLKQQIEEYTKDKKKCAIALSGGIDSAVLLKMMPENTVAYTFKCTIPGMQVTDESPRAAKYIQEAAPNMEHKIVHVYWEDMEELCVPLMKRKGAPIHSIEVQIYKAAMQAKADGCDCFIFGETADCVYGGHSNLLANDWTFGEFVERWSFLMPYKALKEVQLDLRPYEEFEVDGYIDAPKFLTIYEAPASYSSYTNACELAGIDFFAPYAHTIMAEPLDLQRVRRGENKYLIREVFSKLYPGLDIPPKTPMPRPMAEWLRDWEGPTRDEFWPNCIHNLTGDQKWMVYALEKFLNIIDEE